MAIRVSNITAQVLFVPSDIIESVSDTLSFVEEPFARELKVSNFTFQVLQSQSGLFGSASDTLSIEDEATFFLAIADRQVIEDVLSFSETLVNTGNTQSVTDVLAFSDEVRASIFNLNLSPQKLFLHDQAVYCFGAPWEAISITDTIAFEDVGAKVEEGSASDTITFTDTADSSQAPAGDGDTIDFTQSVSVGFGHTIESEIEFTQDVQTFSDFLRTHTDSNVVGHSLTYFFEDSCSQKRYSRFVGEGSADTIPEERLIFDASFVLESIDDGTVLVLRNPESDDRQRLGFNRVNRETRGGELNIFTADSWAKVQTLLFTLVALSDGKGSCPDVIGDLLDFMQDNLGKEIFLHDWYGTSWRGIITTPDEVATEDRHGWWTISFEFEGVEEPGSVPNSTMNISQTMFFNADWNRPLSQSLALTDNVHAGGDINLSVSDSLDLQSTVTGNQEITILYDDFGSGATSVTLDGQAPDIGSGTWRAHTDILDDGTMSSPIDAGAYFGVTIDSGTVYRLDFINAAVITYSQGDNCIFGFFEDKSLSNLISGPSADGTLNPTAAKAVHLMRSVSGANRNAFRRGSDSNGAADTQDWTDATLRDSADTVLDLRIELDTTGDTWAATWYAKSTLSSSWTQVGSANLLSNNVGAVGWSQDSLDVECTVSSSIELTEVRPL